MNNGLGFFQRRRCLRSLDKIIAVMKSASDISPSAIAMAESMRKVIESAPWKWKVYACFLRDELRCWPILIPCAWRLITIWGVQPTDEEIRAHYPQEFERTEKIMARYGVSPLGDDQS